MIEQNYAQYPYTQAYIPSTRSFMSMQQPSAPSTSTSNFLWCWIQGGEETARNWYVKPGDIVALWDSDEQVIYLKAADQMGKPTIEILDYSRRKPKEEKELSYVTKDEFNSLSKSLKDLQEEIDSLSIKRDKKEESK